MSHNFQDFLSKQGFDIQEIHAITENVAWFSVCGSDEKYVIKYEKDRLKEQDDTEYQVQKYLYEKWLLVPKPVMFQEGYMVMEKVAGSSLFDLTGGFEYNDSEIPKEYFEQIGQFLAQMHQLPIPEFLQSWVDMQQDFGKWLYNVGLKRVQSAEWRRCFTPVEVQKIIDSYIGSKKYFPMGLKEKSITHNDTFPGNYLFDTDRNLTGAIDFGRVMIAHPLLELVVVLNNRFRFYSQKSKDVFLKGYTNHCHPEFISGSKGISDLLTPEFLQAHVILSATQAIMTGTANGDQRYVDESIQWLREKVLS